MKFKVIYFLIFILQACYAQLQLQANITTERITYYSSEPIYLRLILKNELDNLIQFEDHDIHRHFLLLDENHNRLDLTFKTNSEGSFFIFPHDSTIIMSDITGLFGIYGPINEKTPHGIQIGEYTIQFRMKQEGIVAESNILPIIIIPPPLQELKAFTLYNKGWLKLTNRNLPREEYSKEFIKLSDNYPNSVYALTAIKLGTPYHEKNKDFYLRIINLNPNNFSTFSIIRKLISTYKSEKNKVEAEHFLREIINKHPDTFISREAKRHLLIIEQLSLEEWLNPELVTKRKLEAYRARKVDK